MTFCCASSINPNRSIPNTISGRKWREDNQLTQRHTRTMNTQSNGIVIAQVADQIGGEVATSYLHPGYIGHCAIVAESNSDVIAVLSNGIEAFRVAAYAITPNGGYGSVSIHPTHLDQTHESLLDWIDVGSGRK